MDILGKARRFEARIARTFTDAAQTIGNAARREPLEIVHAIVDAVEQEVQPGGRGTYVFPFNRIKVFVAAASRDARARLEAILDADPSLHDRILEMLRTAGCDTRDVAVKVAYVSDAEPGWKQPEFQIEFARVAHAAPAVMPALSHDARLDLVVIAGTAETSAYSFTLKRIDLGRCAEVRDHRNRLIRTNHVAFADRAGAVNDSVSRRHAHIEYLDAAGEYRVYDDGSAHGTGVVRNGRTLIVPPGSRGIRLQSDDEIVLGEARVRVKIEGT